MSFEAPFSSQLHGSARVGPVHARAAVEGGRALFRLHGRLVRLRNRRLFEYGFTSAQLRILDAIARAPRANLSALAFHLDLSRQAVHRVVHDLVRQGVIELRRDPTDGRARVPHLTETGRVDADCALEWQEIAGRDLTEILRLQDLQFATMILNRLRRKLL